MLNRGQPLEQLHEQARQVSGLTERQLEAIESILTRDVQAFIDTPDAQGIDPLTALEQCTMTGMLPKALLALSPRERVIIEHRFELGGKPHRTLQALANDLGLSRERVRQIQTRALDKLRSLLETTSSIHSVNGHEQPVVHTAAA